MGHPFSTAHASVSGDKGKGARRYGGGARWRWWTDGAAGPTGERVGAEWSRARVSFVSSPLGCFSALPSFFPHPSPPTGERERELRRLGFGAPPAPVARIESDRIGLVSGVPGGCLAGASCGLGPLRLSLVQIVILEQVADFACCNSFAMESGTEEKAKMESLTSPAAFVEGGIQDACDDACSICLEAFCESDPSALTTCKHEFHLQCILEWCQRSSQCPMCWQPISMKDPTSQELLEAVERERNVRTNQTLNTTIFHHPALGDIELQHLPVGNDSELEERILQHLAAAAAMGRSHHFGRREGHRGRSGSHNRPQFLVFSAHPNSPSAGAVSSSSAHGEGDNDSNPATPRAGMPSPRANFSGETGNQSPGMLTYDAEQDAVVSSGNSTPVSSPRFFNRRHSTVQSTPDRAGPSDMQSFSDSLKSRLNAVSMKYKESITKSTRGWKERLFSRNSSVADLGSEVKREVNAGIASVSRMMERLETRSGSRTGDNPTASTSDVGPSNESNNERAVESSSITAAATTTTTSASSSSTPCVTTSGSN